MAGVPEIVAVDCGRVLPWVVVIDRLVMFEGVTVTEAVVLTPWQMTVMVAVPVATPVTSPPGEVTDAMVSSELDQPTWVPVTTFWLPSE